jgi:hypothetical protein
MDLTIKRHSGSCGHCHTDVPIQANVCTGCGARWGTQGRFIPQKLYNDAKNKMKMLTFVLTFCCMAIFFTTFLGRAYIDVVAVTIIIASPVSLLAIMFIFACLMDMSTSKRAKISWWL